MKKFVQLIIIRPKYFYDKISATEVLTLFFKDFTKRAELLKGKLWFKFNDLGLELDMTLETAKNTSNKIKLKVKTY